LRDHLPAVPRSLQPITDDETRMPAAEARARGVPAGQHRSRAVSYSGYGSAGFPLIEVPDSYVEAHPELCKLRWAECGGANILLAPNARTMATNNQIDRERPPAPSKFSPDHPDRSRALVDTAEEWVLYNPSLTLWGHTDREKFPQRGAMLAQYRSYPVSRADGQGRFWRDREFRIVTNATDHPFHIHINPMWVMRIEVPDEQGRWIHHCHILMHEDMGMMQEFECVADAAASNATPRVRVASHDMTDEEVSAIYPRPSVEVSYRQGLSFVDPNPETGQEFPGFQLEIPRLPD
jgi:hypothetical protein